MGPPRLVTSLTLRSARRAPPVRLREPLGLRRARQPTRKETPPPCVRAAAVGRGGGAWLHPRLRPYEVWRPRLARSSGRATYFASFFSFSVLREITMLTLPESLSEVTVTILASGGWLIWRSSMLLPSEVVSVLLASGYLSL